MSVIKVSRFFVSPEDGVVAKLDTDTETFYDHKGNGIKVHEIAPCRPLQRLKKWFQVNFRGAKESHADRRRQSVKRTSEALRSWGLAR